MTASEVEFGAKGTAILEIRRRLSSLKSDLRINHALFAFLGRNKPRSVTFATKLHALKVKIINRSNFALPQYETDGSAGMDIRANQTEPIQLKPLERALIPTGLFIELPHGYEAQIRPRSGLAIKRGLTMLNSPGTIDSDYRGEIKCIVANLSNDVQTIEPGERIAQMVVARHERVEWVETETLDETQRGAGGFGSTGV